MTAGVRRRDDDCVGGEADLEDGEGDGGGDDFGVSIGEGVEDARFIDGLIGVTAGETMVGGDMDGEDGTGKEATVDERLCEDTERLL